MPRNRPRTTNRGPTQDVVEKAIDLIMRENVSVRKAAKTYNLCHVSLQRFINKKKANKNPQLGYKPHNKVLPVALEAELAEYLKTLAKTFYGLTPKEARGFAYKYAVANKLTFPNKWHEFQMASMDWLSAFLKRNPTLSIRALESTSIARASNFNKTTVRRFFDQLSNAMINDGFQPQDIYHVGETEVTTTLKPNKVIPTKGSKQVGDINYHESGTLVTLCLAANAMGNTIPPMFIFPGKNCHDHFLKEGPVGSIGAANGSGWMQSSEFLLFLEHFVNHAKPSVEQKVLLLLDNHDSHIQIEVIDFCRKNGIVLLSFPPHTPHTLQPLHRSVFGPFKKYFNAYAYDWRKTQPGERLNICHIPGLVKKALPLAATPSNVQAGFRCSGLCPFNRFIFDDLEFAPADVTDRPLQHLPKDEPGQETLPRSVPDLHPLSADSRLLTIEDLCAPGPSNSGSSCTIVSPKDIRLLCKAQRKSRTTIKSAVWTNSSVSKLRTVITRKVN